MIFVRAGSRSSPQFHLHQRMPFASSTEKSHTWNHAERHGRLKRETSPDFSFKATGGVFPRQKIASKRSMLIGRRGTSLKKNSGGAFAPPFFSELLTKTCLGYSIRHERQHEPMVQILHPFRSTPSTHSPDLRRKLTDG